MIRLLLSFLLFSSGFLQASTRNHNQEDAKFEFSFGQSLMFISDSDRAEVLENNNLVIPTSSALLLAEMFLTENWNAFLVMNLPLASQKFIIDGQETHEKANPSFLIGPSWTAYRTSLAERAGVEYQLGALLGASLAENKETTPLAVLAARVNLISKQNSTLYIGYSKTFGVNAATILYGVGHRY